MKWLIIAFLMFLPVFVKAQDAYIFTKEQHEQIRKNLQDYKILIKDYNFKSKQYDSLKRAFELVKKLHFSKTQQFDELNQKYLELKRENADLIFYTDENKRLKDQLAHTEKNLEIKTREMFKYKRMYDREHRLKRGDRIIAGTMWGVLTCLGLWTLYISYETNYGF